MVGCLSRCLSPSQLGNAILASVLGVVDTQSVKLRARLIADHALARVHEVAASDWVDRVDWVVRRLHHTRASDWLSRSAVFTIGYPTNLGWTSTEESNTSSPGSTRTTDLTTET